MEIKRYKEIVKKYNPKEPRIRNIIYAFLVGGSIGFLGELVVTIIMVCFGYSLTTSYIIWTLLLIIVASLFTAIGFFDNWVTKVKCGLIIPTTGFAHSVTSSALDYRKDGLITGLGANFFKLAGSVILYGIISAFICVIVKVMIGV